MTRAKPLALRVFARYFVLMEQLDDNAKKLIRQGGERRRAWVKYQLELTGRSMASIAAQCGVGRTALYAAFRRPYPRMEKALADALGVTPQALFPERYDADGLPNRRQGRQATRAPRAGSPR